MEEVVEQASTRTMNRIECRRSASSERLHWCGSRGQRKIIWCEFTNTSGISGVFRGRSGTTFTFCNVF